MEIRYITGDMDFFSNVDLSSVVEEIGKDRYCAHANGWINGQYQVSLGGAETFDEPEGTIENFCELVESLSENSKKLWEGCSNRVIDIAFESGEEPRSVTYKLSSNLLARLNKLKIGIAITIYPVGAYSSS